MKKPIFEFPSYRYEIDDWDFKKKSLLNRVNRSKFERVGTKTMETDRLTGGKNYVRYLEGILRPTLEEFCDEAQVTCSMTDAWCVRYQKGDYQDIHNHRGWGFSALLYLEFDPQVHTPTCFMAPWQDPRTDTTTVAMPNDVHEGTLIIFPSFCHHFVNPNKVRKQRTVISFDLLPELPQHQSLNKNV